MPRSSPPNPTQERTDPASFWLGCGVPGTLVTGWVVRGVSRHGNAEMQNSLTGCVRIPVSMTVGQGWQVAGQACALHLERGARPAGGPLPTFSESRIPSPQCSQCLPDFEVPKCVYPAEGDPGHVLSSARLRCVVTRLTTARTLLSGPGAFSPTSPALPTLGLAGFQRPETRPWRLRERHPFEVTWPTWLQMVELHSNQSRLSLTRNRNDERELRELLGRERKSGKELVGSGCLFAKVRCVTVHAGGDPTRPQRVEGALAAATTRPSAGQRALH